MWLKTQSINVMHNWTLNCYMPRSAFLYRLLHNMFTICKFKYRIYDIQCTVESVNYDLPSDYPQLPLISGGPNCQPSICTCRPICVHHLCNIMAIHFTFTKACTCWAHDDVFRNVPEPMSHITVFAFEKYILGLKNCVRYFLFTDACFFQASNVCKCIKFSRTVTNYLRCSHLPVGCKDRFHCIKIQNFVLRNSPIRRVFPDSLE